MKNILLIGWVLLLALPVDALETVQTTRMKLVAGPSAMVLVKELALTVEADRDRVALDLGRDWDGVTEVRVGADNLEFRALLPPDKNVPRWAIGVAFPSENLIVLQASAQQPARETLRHELSHVGIGRLARSPVPRWFLEGLASVREEAPWSREGVSLVWAARTGQLYPFSALDASFPVGRLDAELAYAQSADFVQYITESSTSDAVAGIVRAVVGGHTFDSAVSDATGHTLPQLEARWRDSLLRWDLVARVLGNPGLLWGLMSLFVVFAYFDLRRRRSLKLRLFELEEIAETAEAFAAAESFASGPVDDSNMPWDDFAEDTHEREVEQAKKPTLH